MYFLYVLVKLLQQLDVFVVVLEVSFLCTHGDKEFQKIATSNGDTKSLVKHLTNKSTPLKITKIKNGC